MSFKYIEELKINLEIYRRNFMCLFILVFFYFERLVLEKGRINRYKMKIGFR